MILGKYGVYAQVGGTPTTMSPCRKIPGSMGVASQFSACRWRDDEGNPGVAFVSRNLDAAYLVQVDQSFDGDQGFRLIELTLDIRGLIKTYFTAPRLIADENLDALWIIGGDDALVLRRPSIVNGRRMWERYRYAKYTTELENLVVSYAASSVKRGKQVVSSGGDVIQLEYDQSGTGYLTDGAGANGASRLPLGNYTTQTYASYWKSKDFIGPNRRVIRSTMHPKIAEAIVQGMSIVFSAEGCDRTAATNYVTYTSSVSPSSQRRFKRFGYMTQGWQFSYQLTFGFGMGATPNDLFVQRAEFEELTLGNRGLS